MNDEVGNLFSNLSAFAQTQERLQAEKEQLQIPGLEDAVETVRNVQEVRHAAIRRDPELEQLYQLAERRPSDLGEALDLLQEIRDGLYRFLY